jgi:predicted transcriptional regulator
MDWELYSFIVRSKQRKAIVLALARPRTPTEIGKETGIRPSHVSRALAQFAKAGIVKCLTPKAKIGRVYRLTASGKLILDELKRSV